jgi:hypothetical protein
LPKPWPMGSSALVSVVFITIKVVRFSHVCSSGSKGLTKGEHMIASCHPADKFCIDAFKVRKFLITIVYENA